MIKMKASKKIAALCALTLAISSFAACGKEAEPSESVSGNNSSEASGDQKLDIYLSEDGTPYYLDADGNKMLLYAYADDTGEEEEYDPTEYYIYDSYDVDGMSFDLPEGWVADSSMAIPMIFQEAATAEEIDYNESIVILSADNVFGTETEGVNEKSITEYFDDCVEQGFYSKYEITDSGDTTFGENKAEYFDLTLIPVTDEESEEEPTELRVRYVADKSDTPYCAVITSYNTDESFDLMIEAFKTVSDSFKVTAEESADAEDTEEDAQAEEDTENEG